MKISGIATPQTLKRPCGIPVEKIMSFSTT